MSVTINVVRTRVVGLLETAIRVAFVAVLVSTVMTVLA